MQIREERLDLFTDHNGLNVRLHFNLGEKAQMCDYVCQFDSMPGLRSEEHADNVCRKACRFEICPHKPCMFIVGIPQVFAELDDEHKTRIYLKDCLLQA
jgi:hypothetical protein